MVLDGVRSATVESKADAVPITTTNCWAPLSDGLDLARAPPDSFEGAIFGRGYSRRHHCFGALG